MRKLLSFVGGGVSKNVVFFEFSDPKNMGMHTSHVVVQHFNIFVRGGGAFAKSQIPLPNWFPYMRKQYQER